MSGSHLSKDFFELIKSIGECKSKQEEDKILSNEVAVLKQRFNESLSPKKMKEAIVRMMYAEMLGHDASFGHIHAVNMTQQVNLLSKRVGYLASAVCLHPGHELTTLLVNTMRRDLNSSNHVEVCATLIAIPKLTNQETLPALLPSVVSLLEHQQEVVRKKAVMALHRFYQLQPACVADLSEKLRRVLCDRDPAVMGASLYILHDAAEADPPSQKDLVPSFVSILKQITEHRLPSSFDYHRMPAPWIQIKLLKVLSTLGAADQRASEGMYEVLYDVLRRADTGINIGYAIIYECVRTITTIYPNLQLLETAANHISRFVSSENHNLKYLGIKALASIVQVNQKYALDHQLLVVDCMEDPDETLKRKTLDLLFRMTNAANVVFVVDKLLGHLRTTSDLQFRTGLTERITQLAERYAPDNSWFITTMNSVFELGGELVRTDVAHNLMRLIAEGSGEDEDADLKLRQFAAQTYFELLKKPKLPDVLMQVVCWVLGEYGYLCEGTPLPRILERLCDAVERQFTHARTRCWVVVAISKLAAQLGELPEQAEEIASKFQNSNDVIMSKYCHEMQALTENMSAMQAALPVDASCEDLEVDADLSFLDGFVAEAIAKGAQQYLAPGERPDELAVAVHRSGGGHALRFDEYQRPAEPMAAAIMPPVGGASSVGGVGVNGTDGGVGPALSSTGLNTAGVAKKWGVDGFQAAPPPAAAPTANTGSAMPTQQMLSAAPYGAPPSRAPAPASFSQPRELTEKEKMAAALFGGITGGGTTPSAAAAAPPATPPVATTATVAQPQPTSGPAQPKERKKKKGVAAAPPSAPAASQGEVDLLGDLLGSISEAPAPAAPTAPPAAPPAGFAANDLLSLLDGPAMSSPVPAAVPAAMPIAMPTAMPAALPAVVPEVSNPAPMAPMMPMGAASMPPTSAPPPHAMVLASDALLKISYEVSTAEESASTMRITLTSLTQSGLRNLSLQIEPSPMIAMTLQAPVGAEVRGSRLSLPTLLAGSSCTIAASVAARSPAAGAEQQLLGQLSYFEAIAPDLRVLSFKLPLHTADLLRPMKVVTAQFGQMWPSHAAEKKAVVHSNLDAQSYMVFLERNLHLAPVDTIGMECIACGKLVGSDHAVLVHSKLGLMAGRAMELTVRSREPRFSDAVHRQIVELLAK